MHVDQRNGFGLLVSSFLWCVLSEVKKKIIARFGWFTIGESLAISDILLYYQHNEYMSQVMAKGYAQR